MTQSLSSVGRCGPSSPDVGEGQGIKSQRTILGPRLSLNRAPILSCLCAHCDSFPTLRRHRAKAWAHPPAHHKAKINEAFRLAGYWNSDAHLFIQLHLPENPVGSYAFSDKVRNLDRTSAAIADCFGIQSGNGST